MISALQASLGNCPSLRRAIESVLYMAECTKADEASEKVFNFVSLKYKNTINLKCYFTEGQRRLEVRSNGDGQNVSLDLYSGRLR